MTTADHAPTGKTKLHLSEIQRARRNGIACPRCGCVALYCHRTTHHAGQTIREKVCHSCGLTTITTETVRG